MLSILCFSFNGFAQSGISCSEIQNLINYRKVFNSLKHIENSDTLVLLDIKNVVQANCRNLKFGNKVMVLSHDSALISKFEVGYSAVQFNGNCNVFALYDFNNVNGIYLFKIVQGCSNEFIECKVQRLGRRFKLLAISSSVY